MEAHAADAEKRGYERGRRETLEDAASWCGEIARSYRGDLDRADAAWACARKIRRVARAAEEGSDDG
jgi:hypothetical protein